MGLGDELGECLSVDVRERPEADVGGTGLDLAESVGVSGHQVLVVLHCVHINADVSFLSGQAYDKPLDIQRRRVAIAGGRPGRF